MVRRKSDVTCKKNERTGGFFLIKKSVLLLSVCSTLIGYSAAAQHDSTLQQSLSHSATSTYDSAINRFKRTAQEQQKLNNTRYREDKISTRQDEIIEGIRKTTTEAKDYMKVGVDTTGLNADLKRGDTLYQIASDGVFINRGSIQTNRNLETSSNILRDLLHRINIRKAALDNYARNLIEFRNRIDSLNRDSVLYESFSDSAVFIAYLNKLMAVGAEIRPTDSAFKRALANVAELQARVNQLVNKLDAGLEQIALFQANLASRRLAREFANLGGPVAFARPFNEIINFSAIKGQLALRSYLRNNIGRIVLLILLGCLFVVFLVNMRRRLQLRDGFNGILGSASVFNYPVLSGLIIVLNIFQFIFPDPSFIFIGLIWTISAVLLTIVFRNSITRYWLSAWLTLFVLFLLVSADNLILQASRPERWIMLGLSGSGALFGSIVAFGGNKHELKEKWIVYFIGFLTLIEVTSMIANIYGRYNLSKTLLTSGFFNVVIAVMLLWTARLINEVSSLAAEAYGTASAEAEHTNLERSGGKVPTALYVIAILGWFVLFARNFYAYRVIVEPLETFVLRKRTIGEFSFTILNLLEFFIILILSALISKAVSFFASDKYRGKGRSSQKSGVGSWLLLIRISILSIGLLLAFAAAGIPMDRVTIILSALSVGIGFGLQALVNNLISGVIISFEKPVSVGDIVEIGKNSGVVKSVGFRSSVITTWDGSEVVIPNGDLLNQHLVNWTHHNTTRRVDIGVNVAYGTDLDKAKSLLEDVVKKDRRILQNPPPTVLANEFGSSAIGLRLLFWVRNINEWLVVRSDTISAIDVALKENGIVIPFPQQDLHIRSLTTSSADKKTGEARQD